MIFGSCRIEGIHTHTFIAYLDENGNFHKPFVLPQEEPGKNKDCQLNYNCPELMISRIELSLQQIRDVVGEDATPVVFDPNINIDAISGANRQK